VRSCEKTSRQLGTLQMANLQATTFQAVVSSLNQRNARTDYRKKLLDGQKAQRPPGLSCILSIKKYGQRSHIDPAV
jgi:hypothetical protein